MTLDEVVRDLFGKALDRVPVLGTIRTQARKIQHLETKVRNLEKRSFDKLTGLPFRMFYEEKVYEAVETYLKNRESFAVIITDLAGLKYANDFFGYTEGDNLVKVAAGILRKGPFRLTRGDTLARVGGDEMGGLLRGNRSYIDAEVKRIKESIYLNQTGLNARVPPVLKTELCIGVGVVTADDADTLLAEGVSLGEIVPRLIELGHKRANADKVAQGIYDRHPEYNRNPTSVNAQP